MIKHTFIEFFKEQSFFHGAALAYYTVFSIVPIMYLAIISFGKIVGQATVLKIIDETLKDQLGMSETKSIMELLSQVNFEKGSFVLNVVGTIALLLSSSALLASLRQSLNEFLDIELTFKDKRSKFWHAIGTRGVTIVFLPFFGLAIVIMYFGQTFLISFGEDFFSHLGSFEKAGLWIMQHLIAIGSNVLMFALIFKYLHDGHVRWRIAFGGAIVTSVLLYGGQLLIRYYLLNYFFGSSVGVAGTILVILAWMYYSSQIIFLGAKFMKVYSDVVGTSIYFRGDKFHPKHIVNRFKKYRKPSLD